MRYFKGSQRKPPFDVALRRRLLDMHRTAGLDTRSPELDARMPRLDMRTPGAGRRVDMLRDRTVQNGQDDQVTFC